MTAESVKGLPSAFGGRFGLMRQRVVSVTAFPRSRFGLVRRRCVFSDEEGVG
jgi:hypothetical protein